MTDDIFLKVYFSKIIVCPELQLEIRSFLTKPSTSYAETLEKVHIDYRAQESGDSIWDSGTGNVLVHRGNFDPKIEGKKEDDLVPPEKKKKLFPNNVHKLLSSTYYCQFKD